MTHRSLAALLCGMLAAAPLLTAPPARAATIASVGAFSGGSPGLLSGVVVASDAEVYGTLVNGQEYKYGAIYNLHRGKLTVLYAFTGGADGDSPNGTPLLDSAGNLYGTTEGGSTGLGTVWELSPPVAPATAWTKTTLWTFQGPDGANPLSGVVRADGGKLYGTTVNGGSTFVDVATNPGVGAIYELTPPAGGATGWTERVVHSFQGSASAADNALDGQAPAGPLLVAGSNTLYGTTLAGGRYNAGTIFKVVANKKGLPSIEVPFYSFKGKPLDGAGPFAGLTSGRNGTLFGTTEFGGSAADAGTVFELVPTSTGYKETVLHRFTGGADGGNPIAPVHAGVDGNVYGVATVGGAGNAGVFFALVPPASGTGPWSLGTAQAFPTTGTSGFEPTAPLTPVGFGFLTVTTTGGLHGDGSVVRINP